MRYIICALTFLAVIVTLVMLTELYQDNQTNVNVDQLIQDTINNLREAGKLIMNIKNTSRYKEYSKGNTNEGYNDVVTEADINANQFIKNFFSINYPKINLFTEEDYPNNKILSKINKNLMDDSTTILNNHVIDESNLIAIVDPLDATHEYTEGLYQFNSIMVCFLHLNQPIIGITYFPMFDQAFWVYNHKKDSQNFHKISQIFNVTRNQSFYNVIVSRSHSGNIDNILTKFDKTIKNINVVKAGGAGYKTIMVLGNIFDLYIHTTNIKIWDICNAIVYGEHFDTIKTYDINLNKIPINLDDPVLHNGFLFTNSTSFLSLLLGHNN